MAVNARSRIVDAMAALYKLIDGTGDWELDFRDRVYTKFKFWNEVEDYPSVMVSSGDEFREYAGGDNFTWGFLNVHVKIYVRGDDPATLVEKALQDIETQTMLNRSLMYDTDPEDMVCDIETDSIFTDQGLFHPHGIGEIIFRVRYQVD